MDNEKNEITEKPSKAKTSALAGVYDIIEVIAISMIIVMLLFTFVARLSTVDGDSMFDTLESGDRVIISKLFYTPKTGDILVFQQPGGFFDEPLIKRVIATEGQTV
ncbi:MAG: signal peptidase I, partial [Clostridiales bacterium]|nr:signal peptidase I [Clostridiales bacterium]